MLITLAKSDYSKVQELIKIKEYNIASAEALFSFTFEDLTYDKIEEYLGLDLTNQDELFFLEKYFKDLFVKLNEEDYLNNEYAKRIKGLNFKEGRYSFRYLKLEPGYIIPYDDIIVNKENYLERSSIGYFEKEFSYPALLEDNTVWMSLDPDEINTMRPYIQKMHGNILVFGLGMGYFPYMASLNYEVTSITIIENNQDIINIFKKYIQPRLDNKIEFNIICEDAFKFIKENDMSKYDCIFMDIWHNPEDGLPLFLNFKSLLKEYKGETYYWLNTSLLAMFRRCLLTLIEENLLGYQDKDYKKAKNEYDRIINNLYQKTKSIELRSYQEVVDLLSDENLQKLVTNCI